MYSIFINLICSYAATQISSSPFYQDLVQQHPHNNFLHTQVEQCVTSVLNNAHTTENGEACHPLLDQVSHLTWEFLQLTLQIPAFEFNHGQNWSHYNCS